MKTPFRSFLGLIALSAFAATPSAFAAKDVSPDAVFAKRAAAGGMLEVQLGELAQKKAASPEVKEFGAMMVTDHGKANAQLASIAKKAGIALPKDVKPKQQGAADSLEKLDGAAFDKAYVNDMVKDHRKTLALFKKAAADATNPELKAFAAEMAPVIEGHLKKAEALQATVGK